MIRGAISGFLMGVAMIYAGIEDWRYWMLLIVFGFIYAFSTFPRQP